MADVLKRELESKTPNNLIIRDSAFSSNFMNVLCREKNTQNFALDISQEDNKVKKY